MRLGVGARRHDDEDPEHDRRHGKRGETGSEARGGGSIVVSSCSISVHRRFLEVAVDLVPEEEVEEAWPDWKCRSGKSAAEIGRAACRGRGEVSVGAGSLKKRK